MIRDHVSVPGAGQMRVELDKKSLFALASDTRLEILKALQPMRRTVSQLSEVVSVDKAAVFRHLKKMEDGGLVKRYEEHGFVYYGLTWKAKDLIAPSESTRIIVLLSATWLLLLCAAIFLSAGLMAEEGNHYLYGFLPTKGATYDQSGSMSNGGISWLSWVAPAVAFGLAAAAATYLAVLRIRKPFQMPPYDDPVAPEQLAQVPSDDVD
jgi:DNA-binding transcriptional ArsR family regulator